MDTAQRSLPFQSAYFIGIKGAGMCALAQVFEGWGVAVSGSDTNEEFFTDAVLRKLGIAVLEGFDRKHVPSDTEAIFYSTAYGDDNPEIAHARKLGKTLYTYAEGLYMILERTAGIGVAGTHGKTTVTAMIGRVLEQAGFDPTVVVGGKVLEWETNARIGKSQWAVAEIDEYQEKFLQYPLRHLVLTSIEYDHPDYFATPERYEEAFLKLIERLPKGATLVSNAAYNAIERILSRAQRRNLNVLRYDVATADGEVPKLLIPGRHNRENALAALTMARALGIDDETIRVALENFRGTARRFEIYCEKPFVVIDDYAHHPRAVTVTLEAARERYPGKKIWVVFHPHTFSRTKVLLHEFAQALSLADHAVVLDIYGSAREAAGTVQSSDLVRLVSGAIHIPSCEEAAAYLRARVGEGEVVIAMGAGDVWKVARALRAS
ncbi:MAG: UDP-N-acetylmuramate--L-alanine ligase [bacterium]|nr:UDP-N-acetylmuramate--L-alanine ligase [bacterium]